MKTLTKTAFKKYVDYVGKNNLSFALGFGKTYSKAKAHGITMLEEKLEAQRVALAEWEALDSEKQFELTVMMGSFLSTK